MSGSLQDQITILNNQTGSFYPSSNPSGYITGVDLSFSGNYYTKTESESRYVNVTGAETILGDKTFHDKVYINSLYVTGVETIVNTTNTNVASNYLILNLTGGAVDGGIFFVTGSGLTGINDSGAIIGFDYSDKFKFGIGTRASDLSVLDTIASFDDVTNVSGNLQTQISTLNNATGNYVLTSQTGQFYPNSNPSGFITGLRPNEAQDNLNAGSSVTLSKAVTINSSAIVNGNFTVDGNVLFVDSVNNRVGVGTVTPISALDIATGNLFVRTGNISTNTIANYNNSGPLTLNYQGGTFSVTNNATTVIHATQAGNIGVGTVTPNERLTVSGNISASGAGIFSNGFPAGALDIGADVNNTTRTSNRRKLASITAPDFTNTKRIEFFNSDSTSSLINTVSIGGRSGSSLFAATDLNFVTTSSTSNAGGTVAMYINSSQNVGIGTTSPTERLTVSGNINASGTVIASNLVYTSGDQTVDGVKTFSNNIVGNGTDNRLPNQLLDNVDDIVTRQLGDSRYSTHNRIIRTDTLGNKSVFEQFIDFEDQYDTDISLSNAFGAANWSVSPSVFGDIWNPSNASVSAFQGQDAHTHNGILLIRGHTTSNNCFSIGMRRATSPDALGIPIRELTCRVFLSSFDFTTQGYFKIGPIPKGGTGGSQESLVGGLMFNPYIHPTNLVIAAAKTGIPSPFTFTTNPANLDFVDTGVNFINLLDRWINITYIVDFTVPGFNPILKIIITREGVTLASLTYNLGSAFTAIPRWDLLVAVGASRELGIQYGKFTYTSRSQIFIDYLYSKYSGTSTAPSNWNSLRF